MQSERNAKSLPKPTAVAEYRPGVTLPRESSTADGDGSTLTEFVPKPSAFRWNPPGMRIQGATPFPEKKASTRRAAKKPRVEPRVSVASGFVEEEAGIEIVPHSESPSASLSKKAGREPTSFVAEEKNRPETSDEILPRFEAAAEWSTLTSANPRTRVQFVLKQFEKLRRQFAARGFQRADFQAFNFLKDNGCHVMRSDCIIGEVPGVEVGDHFHYRTELTIVSLHRQNRRGIDYISAKKSTFRDDKGQLLPVAVCIVASGGYKQDNNNGDTLTYTGEGGNISNDSRGKAKDQELVKGNLALRNSQQFGVPVRVIRGLTLEHAISLGTKRIYYYTGMYDVVSSREEQGAAGVKVWMFTLKRKAGQAKLKLAISCDCI